MKLIDQSAVHLLRRHRLRRKSHRFQGIPKRAGILFDQSSVKRDVRLNDPQPPCYLSDAIHIVPGGTRRSQANAGAETNCQSWKQRKLGQCCDFIENTGRTGMPVRLRILTFQASALWVGDAWPQKRCDRV